VRNGRPPPALRGGDVYTDDRAPVEWVIDTSIVQVAAEGERESDPRAAVVAARAEHEEQRKDQPQQPPLAGDSRGRDEGDQRDRKEGCRPFMALGPSYRLGRELGEHLVEIRCVPCAVGPLQALLELIGLEATRGGVGAQQLGGALALRIADAQRASWDLRHARFDVVVMASVMTHGSPMKGATSRRRAPALRLPL
jgi:hypothetical protein